ncbi:MAG: hypothetical protein ABJA74_10085 [Lapillicoccus sp.]
MHRSHRGLQVRLPFEDLLAYTPATSAAATKQTEAGRTRAERVRCTQDCIPIRPTRLGRYALLARAAGLLGQLAEERRRPVGMDVYLAVDRGAYYEPPPKN